MLLKTVVTKWTGTHNEPLRVPSASGNTFLLNGSHINGILVRDTNKTQFMYSDNPNDFRAKASYIETSSTKAAIKAAADLTFQSAFVALLIYPLNDATATPVSTEINCESIAYVYPDPAYTATKSYVVYYEGSKRREVRVAYSINQILSLADDSNLTTI